MNIGYTGTPDYKRMFEQAAEERDYAINSIKVKDIELRRFGEDKSALKREATKAGKLVAKLKLLLTDAGISHGL